ncbi:LacI family DNA-binding transcriptional regulator [Vagococcus carniphilus]|uniref:LacI family DNA-binding transcriptional regulator n=1 Tax=Vagococcus carniphilus TaxID=218144 RepID=A0AAW8UBK4_9ENTE|nr:LacI family DNA-binding transcriptional regulator [Vagococcus carniphilus]MDT2834632.1 LacI family DNA-binding transcriptional regulator [Vagococcus carniphilus]MDT2849234.1 LacI family DNA-binding transcriptional regulator [Vagococcus carniphilus]
MSVTIKDVAKEVGVAPSTVSRTLRDHPSISRETKEKVRKAMDKLGYVPNVSAQNLANKHVNTIGAILPVIGSKERKSNPFYLEIITAMNEEASQQKVTLSIASGKTQQELLENVQLMYRQKRVDGFIMLYVEEDDMVLDYLIENKVPFTMIGQPYKFHNEASCVDNDNQLLGWTATQHLVDKGHERIAFVTNNDHENFFRERFFGYQKGMMDNQLRAYPAMPLITPDDFIALDDFLKEEQPTACIAIDDMFALRLIQMLNLSGFKVPDDISVISFNNSIFTSLLHPYITSIDVNATQLGKTAVQEFLLQLKEPDAIKKRVIIPHTLIENETVLNRKN